MKKRRKKYQKKEYWSKRDGASRARQRLYIHNNCPSFYKYKRLSRKERAAMPIQDRIVWDCIIIRLQISKTLIPVIRQAMAAANEIRITVENQLMELKRGEEQCSKK